MMVSSETLNVFQFFLLLVAVALFLRVLANQRTAARVARETEHRASEAATNAAQANAGIKTILERMETGGIATGRTADRIERRAENVADDLQAQHDRADAVNSTEPGAAADAAATTAPKEPT